MDDEMIDLVAGDAMLRRRLEAYAEERLTPDSATSSRIRARVLAVAHRRADLARADAALMIVPTSEAQTGPGRWARGDEATRSHRAPWRRTVAALLAASLGIGLAAGTALAARPGGVLYEARLSIEALTLPTDPSARAVAELERLEARLVEADEASRAGDLAAAEAALAAYGRIIEQASAAAIAAHDEVAVAVLEAGVGRNVGVLQALVERVPSQAGEAIGRAIDRAIERSDQAIDAIETSKPDRPDRSNGGGGAGPAAASPKPTKAPTGGPTAKPTKAPATKPTNKPPKPDPTPRRTPPHGGG